MSWISIQVQGKTVRVAVVRSGEGAWVSVAGTVARVTPAAATTADPARAERDVRAPMTGRVVKVIKAGRAPQEVAFSGARALLTSGYGSSIEAVLWRTYRRLGTVPMPYGSFNLATFGGQVVTSSLFTGQVTALRAGTLRRFWTAKVAPATRYVAISLWPH